MADPVELVKKLIALSASTNLEEARNAAWKACALIRKHDIPVGRPPRSEKEKAADDLMADIFYDTLRRAQERRQREAYEAYVRDMEAQRGPPPEPSPRKRPKPAPKPSVNPRGRTAADVFTVPVTCALECSKCKDTIRIGTFAVWVGIDHFHEACAPKR